MWGVCHLFRRLHSKVYSYIVPRNNGGFIISHRIYMEAWIHRRNLYKPKRTLTKLCISEWRKKYSFLKVAYRSVSGFLYIVVLYGQKNPTDRWWRQGWGGHGPEDLSPAWLLSNCHSEEDVFSSSCEQNVLRGLSSFHHCLLLKGKLLAVCPGKTASQGGVKCHGVEQCCTLT